MYSIYTSEPSDKAIHVGMFQYFCYNVQYIKVPSEP